ncbi:MULTISPECIES: DUF2931 domain-containing protein [unclassified Pseudoalteromonas]|uniref:DUF2931 domain-containing protein n=1 Tax=unclassified Pseudoalteromonas TaxID=194690 RepID=UPI0025B3CCA8|nr:MULTISPECIES: DUF2931 domain-containing protein [unclassified Pseudoalteromonas]MDN3378864.1 DUF2931 domain-containing protein [Pseudoalteromonas sp. APC 3893]MDN3387510.1 DUF2931 domain-containing protein [Pseudoalteromonas sp. APC 4017]
MDKILKLLLISLFAVLLSACATTGEIDYMVVSGSTDEGNDIFVTLIKFDDQWDVPAGTMSCCRATAGAMVGVYDRVFPGKVAVEWLDKSENRLYFGEVAIDKKGYKLANKLPRFSYHTGEVETDIYPYLIVGMGESGEIKVWISNTPSAGFTGRVLHELGSGQAQWRENNE